MPRERREEGRWGEKEEGSERRLQRVRMAACGSGGLQQSRREGALFRRTPPRRGQVKEVLLSEGRDLRLGASPTQWQGCAWGNGGGRETRLLPTEPLLVLWLGSDWGWGDPVKPCSRRRGKRESDHQFGANLLAESCSTEGRATGGRKLAVAERGRRDPKGRPAIEGPRLRSTALRPWRCRLRQARARQEYPEG